MLQGSTHESTSVAKTRDLVSGIFFGSNQQGSTHESTHALWVDS